MTTDWLLMRRAAAELEQALRGGRVTDAGVLDDGRIGLRFGGLERGLSPTLAIDAFASPPLVTLERDEFALVPDPGWLRTAGTTLRGMRLRAVEARTGDRVIVLSFASASRFGVRQELRLVLELVPRYGNVVLLRERLVVAAAKQFSPAENAARSVQAGMPYEPPPLPRPALDAAGFAAAVAGAADARALSRDLGAFLPALPRLLADAVAAEAHACAFPSSTHKAAWLTRRAADIVAEAETAAGDGGELYAYRDATGKLVAAHVVPLAQFAGLEQTRTPSLLTLFAEARAAAQREQHGGAVERRRAALAARVERRARAAAAESAQLAARLEDAAGREYFRLCGDALFTHAHEVESGATAFVPATNPELTIALDPDLDAKENARKYFARYRKAADALPHLERRRDALRRRVEALEELRFEIERADAATLRELAEDLDALEGRAPAAAAQPARKRAVLRFERPSGARIYVGRSPRENAEVTFRIARPDDLWFHARGVPGSHVVLQLPSGSEPRDDDLDAAADLAAAHSKARASGRVEIDYTERKHVRKQRDGGPGLVWYTHARTRVGNPRDASSPEL
jgi:predicted ribosome quality control (RQC) complex YloA/Tae2 family protein